jgi:predicted anti-sigma-YlaC factor YlaD
MNCREWEERLALYAGGDLGAAENAQVERHLHDCAGCQMFLSGLRQGLQVLQEVHGEEPPPAYFAAVRARVLAEVSGEPRFRWVRRWALGCAMAAVAVLLVVSTWPGRRPGPAPQVARVTPPVEAAPAPAAVAAAPQRVTRAIHRARRPRPERAPAPAPPARPLVVKLVTDDPDVVIYWITETRGE